MEITSIIKITNPISHKKTAHARKLKNTGNWRVKKSNITSIRASQNRSCWFPFFHKNTPNKTNMIAPPMIAKVTGMLPKHIYPFYDDLRYLPIY